MRVLCDVASIDRTFDYIVGDRLIERFSTGGSDPMVPGTMLRVPLHGRQVAAWIVEVDSEPPAEVELLAATRISSLGPSAELIELARWAAWRWAGRLQTFMGLASPSAAKVMALPAPARPAPPTLETTVGERVRAALAAPVSVLRLPPAASPLEVIRGAALAGNVLVIVPTAAQARTVADGMRRSGLTVALHPEGWARGAAGCSIVGTRSAAWAPVSGLGAIVVLDEHDETLQNEGSPTWHAREVAIERARLAGVPVVLVSPTPSLEALAAVEDADGSVVTIDRARERQGWARLEVLDRREDDPRSGLYSERLVRALQSEARVVCVLNRTGRAQLLACHRCGTLATCAACDGAVREDTGGVLHCPRCGTDRPTICTKCSATVMRSIRVGVTKAREQLETLIRERVDEITGAKRERSIGIAPARVTVGTEAVLQRVSSADVVAFLEFDQVLGAPRYRATEQALTMLAKASRLVGGRRGEVLVQTRQPEHEVFAAALLGDPTEVSAAERRRREMLTLPPVGVVAAIGGEAGPAFIAELRVQLGGAAGVSIDQPDDGRWLVRSRHRTLVLDALAATRRPPGRLQLQVDPARLPF
ncbi:MAG: hypothetical protein GX868_09710 [Actinobacteria bacterium]|nr:hypothetical protein [Actinomycetota bacterium]